MESVVNLFQKNMFGKVKVAKKIFSGYHNAKHMRSRYNNDITTITTTQS